MGMGKVEVDRKNNNGVKFAVDGVNNNDKDVKDAKLQVSTIGMDKVKVDRNNKNEVKIAADDVNVNNADVKDAKLKVSILGWIKSKSRGTTTMKSKSLWMVLMTTRTSTTSCSA